jgi:glycosyltransferase involved in cell wall biosynthesis
MSAGTIPVVINTAGQKEVVIDSKNGFLWNNSKELSSGINKAIQSKDTMKPELRNVSEKFSKPAFEKALKNIFNDNF